MIKVLCFSSCIRNTECSFALRTREETQTLSCYWLWTWLFCWDLNNKSWSSYQNYHSEACRLPYVHYHDWTNQTVFESFYCLQTVIQMPCSTSWSFQISGGMKLNIMLLFLMNSTHLILVFCTAAKSCHKKKRHARN